MNLHACRNSRSVYHTILFVCVLYFCLQANNYKHMYMYSVVDLLTGQILSIFQYKKERNLLQIGFKQRIPFFHCPLFQLIKF